MRREMEAMYARLEEELDHFRWAYPGQEENQGEVHLDTEAGTLVLVVWTHDTENPDDEEMHALDVSRPVDPDMDPRQQIRRLVHAYLCHEADEHMWFGPGAGEQTFHPHCPHCGGQDMDYGATGLNECNTCGGLSRGGKTLREAEALATR